MVKNRSERIMGKETIGINCVFTLEEHARMKKLKPRRKTWEDFIFERIISK